MLAQHRIFITFNKFKDAIKRANKNYPLDLKGELQSTTKLTNKELVDHIEFITKWAGEYGITPQIVNDEWDRLLQKANECYYTNID